MNKIAKINDAIDGWKTVLDYLLSRQKKRYNTLDELKDDINEKYKTLMQTIQDNYDRWFDTELLQNFDSYGIEILGGDAVVEQPDAIEEDDDMSGIDNVNDKDDDMFDEPNSDIDEDMFEEDN